jgi:PAS domain S-box-containing protein
MPTVVLIAAPEGLVEPLRSHGLEVSLAHTGDEAVRVDGVAAVVVDSNGTDPVAVAQTVFRHDRSLPVLVLVGDRSDDDTADRLRIAPLIGSGCRCLERHQSLEAIASEIATASRAGLRQRLHQRRMAKVAEELPRVLGSSPPQSQYLGQLVELAPIAVLTVAPDGTVLGWNPAAERLTGRSERDAIGQPVASLFPAEARPRLASLLRHAEATGEVATSVLARRGPLGDEQLVELTISAIDDAGTLGHLVIGQDVTARLGAERELRNRARNAALAAAVGFALTRPDPLNRQLQRCVEAVVTLLEAAFARVWTHDPEADELVLRASAGMYTHLDGAHSRVRVGELKIGRIAASRRPHLTNRVVGDPQVGDQAWARREGMVAFAGYPLVAGDELVGVLALFARDELAQSTLDALAAVADTIAIGIQQARRDEQVRSLLELEQLARATAEGAVERYATLARTLQQSLLPPRLPRIAGLDVAASYHYAGRGDVIGGDFYDLFLLPGGRWCATLGDVAGKGVGAAQTTALARYTLRTAARSGGGPVEMLRTLNEVLFHDDGTDRYCTLVLVTGDPARPGEMTVVAAGHPLPALVPADGGLRWVGRHGMPVGMFEDAGHTEEVVRLSEGDALVLYTDGVTEARSPEGAFRPELLDEVLGGLNGRSAAAITSAIETAVIDFQEGHPRDDLAVMALVAGAGWCPAPEGR